MNQKEKSIEFWNQFFQNHKPMTIEKKDIEVSTTFEKYLKMIGDQCEHVLDIGCGIGTCLMGSLLLGHKMKEGVGFDTSVNAIHFARETVKQSKIKGLTYHVADETFLKQLDNHSFDGIICSNFLDVIPEDLSQFIVNHIKRILAPNGLFLLKLNFYLDEERLVKFNMEKIADNTYQMNGVIRSFNLTTETWLQKFSDFEVVHIDGYKRAENLPEDRIILLRKK